MPDLSTLRRGLDYLALSLGHEHGNARLIIQLPEKPYQGLHRQVAELRIAESERSGNGGIVVDYAPPTGKSFGTGFWLHGHWIEGMAE